VNEHSNSEQAALFWCSAGLVSGRMGLDFSVVFVRVKTDAAMKKENEKIESP
jgi:hypothetical protein